MVAPDIIFNNETPLCQELGFRVYKIMKETYYFSHDYNARSDEKILKLIASMGWEGYGLYWAIIEKLYEAEGYLEKDYQCIAFDLRTDSERISKVVESGLFVFNGKKFYSKSALARLKLRKDKSDKARQSSLYRWNKPYSDNANAMRTQSDGNAIKERKGKERKYIAPTSNEVGELTPEQKKNIEEIRKGLASKLKI